MVTNFHREEKQIGIALWCLLPSSKTLVKAAFKARLDTFVYEDTIPDNDFSIESSKPISLRVLLPQETPHAETRSWFGTVKHVFLIHQPKDILATMIQKNLPLALHDTGFPQQFELFEMVCATLKQRPPVLLASDVNHQPGLAWKSLCDALGIPFRGEMTEKCRPQDGFAPTGDLKEPAPPLASLSSSEEFLTTKHRPLLTVCQDYFDLLVPYRLEIQA